MRKIMIGVAGSGVILGFLIFSFRFTSDYDVEGEIVEIHQLDNSFITIKGQRFSKYPIIHLNITDKTAIYKQDDPTSAEELSVGQCVGVMFEDAAAMILSDLPTTNAKKTEILN